MPSHRCRLRRPDRRRAQPGGAGRDRAGHQPAFPGLQTRLGAAERATGGGPPGQEPPQGRDGGRLAFVEPDRRHVLCLRPFQRLAHPAFRHRNPDLQRRSRRDLRRTTGLPARPPPLGQPLWHNRSRADRAARRHPDPRHAGRQPCRPLRPRRSQPRHGQGDLWHRVVADDADAHPRRVTSRAFRHHRLDRPHRHRLRAGGQHHRLGPGRRLHGGASGDQGRRQPVRSGPDRPRQRRSGFHPRPCRPWRAALG